MEKGTAGSRAFFRNYIVEGSSANCLIKAGKTGIHGRGGLNLCDHFPMHWACDHVHKKSGSKGQLTHKSRKRKINLWQKAIPIGAADG